MKHLKFLREDNGFCRVYYREIHSKGLYCLQGRKEDFSLYICSKDGEPSHSIPMDNYVLGLPTQETTVGKEAFSFLMRK